MIAALFQLVRMTQRYGQSYKKEASLRYYIIQYLIIKMKDLYINYLWIQVCLCIYMYVSCAILCLYAEKQLYADNDCIFSYISSSPPYWTKQQWQHFKRDCMRVIYTCGRFRTWFQLSTIVIISNQKCDALNMAYTPFFLGKCRSFFFKNKSYLKNCFNVTRNTYTYKMLVWNNSLTSQIYQHISFSPIYLLKVTLLSKVFVR